MSLPAAVGLAGDAALLDALEPGGPMLERWWRPAAPAVVVGLGLHHRIDRVVDTQRCDACGVAVLARQAGGGALLLSADVVCGAFAIPIARVASDVTESYRWLGDALAEAVQQAGVPARRIGPAEARADVAALRDAAGDEVAVLLLSTCYGTLSPHEVVVGGRKLVGLAQVRRRQGALFQVGILLSNQSPLADFLAVPSEATRELLRGALLRRTIGLSECLARAC